MNYNIEGVLELSQIKDYEIINNIDVCEYVYINDYINKSVNNIKNNDISQLMEILSVSIKLDQINKKKINANNTNIYCINFIYSITLYISINSKFEQININKIYLSSFTYKDIDTSYLEIHPINLEIKNLEDKIYFIINLITIDKTKELNLENSIEPNDQIIENINNKDYSYININQEFI